MPGNFVIIAGQFRDSIQAGAWKQKSYGNTDAFITKISDNSITRGVVSSGPYCAGDSIYVPFTKVGHYDTSNYFMAELSDENGNFTGGQRELGRLKSDKAGVVVGRLPDLHVSSSDKYRIRIVSTAPVVQSYYKVDTLRLLIYSRDKAWAGNDTSICLGDSVVLRTYGGTRWQWSPKYRMQDSTKASTLAWPDKTTTYRIAISDSSGCGAPDTAYKTIKVRPALKVSITTPLDTAVCIGGTMPIVAHFSGGDSLNYSCQWYSINSLGVYNLVQTSQLKQADTFNFTIPPSEPDSMRLVLYLSDGCTPKTAFAGYTLKVKKLPAQVAFKYNDTSLCPGKSNALIAVFKGSPKDKLSWSWQENTSITNQWAQRRTGNNKQSDTWNYTLLLNWKGTKKIRLLLNDACSGLKDTAILSITPKDTIKISLNTSDTTLCYGRTYTWRAGAAGGSPKDYKYLWTDLNTGDTLSMADTLRLTATRNRLIKLLLNDGCMPQPGTATFKLSVTAPLQTSVTSLNDTVICHGDRKTFRSQVQGGTGQYTYRWLLNNWLLSNRDSANLNNDGTQSGPSTLKLIVSDGCTTPEDTTLINVNLLAPIQTDITYPDSLCSGQKILLRALVKGGTARYNFRWQKGAQLLSQTDSISIQNNQAGISQYSLIVTDGCSVNDTSELKIKMLPALALHLNTADSCPAGPTWIHSGVNGGRIGSRNVNWYHNNTLLGSGDSIQIDPSLYSSRTFKAVADDGCSVPNITNFINLGSAPKVKILAGGECLGDTTMFKAIQQNSAKALSYDWKVNGSTESGNDSILRHVFSVTGPYKVRVDLSTGGTCKGSDSISGFILVKPKADFIIAHFERTAQGIPFRFINQSTNDNTWLWNFGDGDTSQHRSPEHSFRDTGMARVKLIVSNQNKCFDSTSLSFPVMDKIEFFFPTAFSPNGNGINESFGLSANQWNKVREFNLKIYNRWGEMVFDSDHMEQHWTGEGAQQSVYIYKVTIRDVYNVLHEVEGVVELLL